MGRCHISGGGIAAFDITNPKEPKKAGFAAVAAGIETLFNSGHDLYVGSEAGVYIYDIEDPNQPTRLSSFGHARSCDPVVTQGAIAYVSLRSDYASCPGDVNELSVVDVTHPDQPIELSSFSMTNPGGLGVSGNRLFVCDGAEGLVELNVANPKAIVQVTAVADEVCYDVIPSETSLVVSGSSGISQYDLNSQELKRLSRIEIGAVVKPTTPDN